MASSFDLEAQHRDVDSKITVGLVRLSQALRVLLWDQAKTQGLSPIQIRILIYLKYHRRHPTERRVTALARRFDLSKATVSAAVATLVSKGLLERRRDPGDARVVTLETTPAGATATSAIENWADRARDAVATLPPEHKGELLHAILLLVERLRAAGVITVARLCLGCRYLRVTPDGDAPYRCVLLERPLEEDALRVDCPEYEAA